MCLAVETKLLGLGHCLLADSVSISVRDVRGKGFYSIPVISILDSEFTFQSLRESWMHYKDTDRKLRPGLRLLHDLGVVPLHQGQ